VWTGDGACRVTSWSQLCHNWRCSSQSLEGHSLWPFCMANANILFCSCDFYLLLLSFFPRLFSTVGDWISTICAPSHEFVGLYIRNWGMYRQSGKTYQIAIPRLTIWWTSALQLRWVGGFGGLPANFNGFRILQRRHWTEVNQTLHEFWPSPGLVHHIYIFGAVALTEFWKVQNSQSLAFSYIGTVTARHSSSRRYGKLCGV